MLEKDARLIFASEEVASATKPPKGIVVEEPRHGVMILPFSLPGALTA